MNKFLTQFWINSINFSIARIIACIIANFMVSNFMVPKKYILCKIIFLKYHDYLYMYLENEGCARNQWLIIYLSKLSIYNPGDIRKGKLRGSLYPANYGALARLCRPQVQSGFGLVSFVSISDRARSNTTRSSAISRDSRKI